MTGKTPNGWQSLRYIYISRRGVLDMNEKKREKLIRVCRVVAAVLAAAMVFGVVLQGFVF